jgi:hypothetical protein
VLAAQYYLVAASALAVAIPGGEPRSYSTVGLLLVFVVATLAINSVGYYVDRSTRLPVIHLADHFGGAALGALSAWLFVSLVLTTADFGLATPLAGLEVLQRDALRLIQGSAIAPVVHSSMPALYETLRPWIPQGIPAPFAT